MAQLFDLPVELILQCLRELDLKPLLRCRQISKFFNRAIDDDVTLQYKIELVSDGMEDGPPSPLGPADRLQLLRQHRSAWWDMDYTSIHDIPMAGAGIWELCGGVLAQGIHESGLIFTQLPSALRHIEMKSWSLQNLGIRIRDFGMDPAQDLLVLIAKPPPGSTEFTIHLRSLQDGRPHPSARSPAIISYSAMLNDVSFTIQVCEQYLGIMFENDDAFYEEIIIWNWQTGAMEMSFSVNSRCTFAFLTIRHLLFAYGEDDHGEIVLIVFDFISTSPEKTMITNLQFVCKFKFPRIDDHAITLDFLLRSDPSPGWKPHRDLAVPFYNDRRERLFVFTSRFSQHVLLKSLSFFIPSSTLLRHVERCESKLVQGERLIPWDCWGPQGTRLCPTPGDHSSAWVCFVYGMSCVGITPADGRDHATIIQVFDFNQVGARKILSEMRDQDNDGLTGVTVRTTSVKDVFCEPVATCLPFLRRTFRAPLPGIGRRDPIMMLSEDALIMVNDVSVIDAVKQTSMVQMWAVPSQERVHNATSASSVFDVVSSGLYQPCISPPTLLEHIICAI